MMVMMVITVGAMAYIRSVASIGGFVGGLTSVIFVLMGCVTILFGTTVAVKWKVATK